MTPKKLTVLVCLYYEEECVEEFVRQVSQQLNNLAVPWEILFIDDGSQDATVEIVSGLASQDPQIKLVALNRNYGKEAAITAGIEYASGDVIIMMDPDLQDPPHRIKDFYSAVVDGNDLVWGIREQQSRGLLDKVLSKAFWSTLRGMTGLNIPVNVAVMRGFNKRFADAFLKFPEQNRFIEGIFATIGFRTTEIVIENQPRFAGHSKFTLKKRIALAAKAITAFSDRPLKLGVTLGSCGLLASITYGAYLVGRKLIFGIGLEGWTSTIAIVLFMGSLNMAMVGLSGIYVGRIYRELKNRPLFLIDKLQNIPSRTSVELKREEI